MTGILINGQMIPNGSFQIASSNDLKNDSGVPGTTISDALNSVSASAYIWDGAIPFSTFYADSGIATLTNLFTVTLTGTGHTIDNKSSAYTNLDKIMLFSGVGSTVNISAGATATSLPHLNGIRLLYSTTDYFAVDPVNANNLWYVLNQSNVSGVVTGAKFVKMTLSGGNINPYVENSTIGNALAHGEQVFDLSVADTTLTLYINNIFGSNSSINDGAIRGHAGSFFWVVAYGNYTLPAADFFVAYSGTYRSLYATGGEIVRNSSDVTGATVEDALNTLAGSILITPDQRAALDAAHDPSATNAFATMNDVPAKDSLVWYGTDSFSLFYHNNTVSGLTVTTQVTLSGTGHTINNSGSQYTNLDKLVFYSGNTSAAINISVGATADSLPHLDGHISLIFNTTDYFVVDPTNAFWSISGYANPYSSGATKKCIQLTKTAGNNMDVHLYGSHLGNSFPNGYPIFNLKNSGTELNILVTDAETSSAISDHFVDGDADSILSIVSYANFTLPASNFFTGFTGHYFSSYNTSTAMINPSTDRRYVTDNEKDALDSAAIALTALNPVVDTTTLNNAIAGLVSDTVVWNSATTFSDFYTAHVISAVSRNVLVLMESDGVNTHTINNRGSKYTNLQYLEFDGGLSATQLIIADGATIDAFPILKRNIVLHSYSASSICVNPTNNINMYIGAGCSIVAQNSSCKFLSHTNGASSILTIDNASFSSTANLINLDNSSSLRVNVINTAGSATISSGCIYGTTGTVLNIYSADTYTPPATLANFVGTYTTYKLSSSDLVSDSSNVSGGNVKACFNTINTALSGFVPSSRKINGYTLTSDITLTKSDLSLGNVVNLDTSTTANISASTDKNFVSDDASAAITGAATPSASNVFATMADLPSAGEVLIGNEVYIDKIYGNDTTGEVDSLSHKFATFNAARAAIVVAHPSSSYNYIAKFFPGTYTDAMSLFPYVSLIGDSNTSTIINPASIISINAASFAGATTIVLLKNINIGFSGNEAHTLDIDLSAVVGGVASVYIDNCHILRKINFTGRVADALYISNNSRIHGATINAAYFYIDDSVSDTGIIATTSADMLFAARNSTLPVVHLNSTSTYTLTATFDSCNGSVLGGDGAGVTINADVNTMSSYTTISQAHGAVINVDKMSDLATATTRDTLDSSTFLATTAFVHAVGSGLTSSDIPVTGDAYVVGASVSDALNTLASSMIWDGAILFSEFYTTSNFANIDYSPTILLKGTGHTIDVLLVDEVPTTYTNMGNLIIDGGFLFNTVVIDDGAVLDGIPNLQNGVTLSSESTDYICVDPANPNLQWHISNNSAFSCANGCKGIKFDTTDSFYIFVTNAIFGLGNDAEVINLTATNNSVIILAIDNYDGTEIYARDIYGITGSHVTIGHDSAFVAPVVGDFTHFSGTYANFLTAHSDNIVNDSNVTGSTITAALNTLSSGKQDALGYTAENSANKKTGLTDDSDTYYPSQKAVKTYVDNRISPTYLSVNLITDLAALPTEQKINGKVAFVVENKKLYKYNSGTSTWDIYFDFLPYAEYFCVDPTTGSDTLGNGTYMFPFKTIAKAVTLTTAGGASAIMILDSITEDLTITTGRDNIQFTGISTVTDAQVVKWIGKVVISGTVTRLKFIDLQMNYATQHPVEISSTAGRHYFENCTFTRDDTTTGTVVLFTGNNYRWHEFYKCNATGVISLEGSPSSYCDIRITGVGAWEQQINMAGTTDNYNVRIIDIARHGLITHTRGYLDMANINEMQPTSTNCVTSTAAVSAKNKLIMRNVCFKKHDTNVYGKINKTGDCVYVLDGCDRDYANDVLTGTRRDFGNIDKDLKNTTAVSGASICDAVTTLASSISGKVDANTAITGATKTKITYDAKGLVTVGADATTADIADSLNKRYVTDAGLASNTNAYELFNRYSLDNFVTVTDTGLVVNNGVSAYYPSIIHDANAFGANDGYNFKIIYSAGSYLRVIKSKDCATWTAPVNVTGLVSTAHHPSWVYSASGFGTQGAVKYKLIYWNSSVSNRLISTLRCANSVDGLTWTDDQPLTQDVTCPIISGVSGDWNGGTWGFQKIFYNDNATNTGTNPFDYKYAAYYDANTGTTYETTGLAYSTDFINWVRYAPNAPVLDRTSGDSGAWDYYTASMGSVTRDINGFHFWYTGGKATGNTDNYGWGYASSPDGLVWTKSASNPIMTTADGVTYRDQRCYTPTVADDGCGTVYIVYTAQGSAQSGAKCLALASLKYAANQEPLNPVRTLIDGKEPTITAGTTSQYWRGDKSWQTLDKSAVGLGNVSNTDTTTTANISDYTDKRFCTDAQKTVIGNTSNTNTGDETTNSIKTKLGAASTSADGYLTSTDWNKFNAPKTSLVWNGATAFSAFYTANNLSTITSQATIILSGTGHAIDVLLVEATPTTYSNIKFVAFNGGESVKTVEIADGAVLDAMPMLTKVILHSNSATAICVDPANTAPWELFDGSALTVAASCLGISVSGSFSVTAYDSYFTGSSGSHVFDLGASGSMVMRLYGSMPIGVYFPSAYIFGLSGAALEVYNTSGIVPPTAGSMTHFAGTFNHWYLDSSTLISNDSGSVTGASISDALNTLNTSISGKVSASLTSGRMPVANGTASLADSGFVYIATGEANHYAMCPINGYVSYASGQSVAYGVGASNFVGAPFNVFGKNFDNAAMSATLAAVSSYGDKSIYYGDIHDVDETPTSRDIYIFDPINDTWILYDDAGTEVFNFVRSTGDLTITGAISATNVGAGRPEGEEVTTSTVILTADSARNIIITLAVPTSITVSMPDATTLPIGWSVFVLSNTDNANTSFYKNDGTTGFGQTMNQHNGRMIVCLSNGTSNGTWGSGTDQWMPAS